MTALLFGKLEDPNIRALAPLFDVFVDQEAEIEWSINDDLIRVGNTLVTFDKFFGRANVFGKSTDQMAANFFLIKNYLLAHSSIKRHNSKYERETPTKAANLILAKRIGLCIPETIIGTKSNFENGIVKPLTGGFQVQNGNSSIYASILQEKIVGKNRRVFIIGGKTFGFEIQSNFLDYRIDPSVKISEINISKDMSSKCLSLAGNLGLTYAAIDFISDYFLEINSMPMFVAFDVVSNNKLATEIRDSLDTL
jgi:hypothetical protein